MNALRMFMGLQTIAFGVLYMVADEHTKHLLMGNTNHSETWAYLLQIGGAWLVVLSLIDFYVNHTWKGFGTKFKRWWVSHTFYLKVGGSFFSGISWVGLGSVALWDSKFSLIDFMAVTFIIFLTFIMYVDAKRTRGRVIRREIVKIFKCID